MVDDKSQTTIDEDIEAKNAAETQIPQRRFEAGLAALRHVDCDRMDNADIVKRVLAAADAVRAPLRMTFSKSQPFVVDVEDCENDY